MFPSMRECPWKWTPYLFHKKVNNYSNRTLACVSYVNSAGSSVPRRFCVHSAWSLRSDGREHGGRGFQAGRTRLSTARMANFRGIGTGENHMRRPTMSKLLLADSRVPILCHCRDCSRPSPDDFRPVFLDELRPELAEEVISTKR